MANLTQQMIDFAMSLPPSTNPYETTAAMIRKETQTAKPAFWAVILRRIIDFHYLVLSGQAITALWLRKKSNKLHFFRYNKLGLIHVEVLNDIVLLMLVFSLLAFIDGIAQELAEQHLIRFSSKMVIHTSKFCFSAAACWLFVWILSIEAAMNLTSLGARARAGASIRLPPYTRFIINSLLLAVMAVPSVMIVCVSILRATILAAIEATSEKVIATLLKNAPAYRAERDNYSNLLQILKPTESIPPNSKRLAYNTKLMLIVYFVQHVMILAVSKKLKIFRKKSPSGFKYKINDAKANAPLEGLSSHYDSHLPKAATETCCSRLSSEKLYRRFLNSPQQVLKSSQEAAHKTRVFDFP